MEQNITYTKLFLDKKPEGIVQPDGSLGTQNTSDYYLNIPLTKTFKKVEDYVQISKSPFRTEVPRPNFNPYFIELNFFEDILAKSATGNTFINITNAQQAIDTKVKKFKIDINR